MLQKSVWIGQHPLSQDVLEQVNKNGIFNNVHILEVKNIGTVGNVDWDE